LERLVEERSRALIALQEEQVRERRLSAVGQLAAGVMHDVNNALNPIMAAAYLLRHHAESPDAVRDYADRIRKAAEIGAATASRVT
jgi:signal transduction histidine kinase